MSKPLVSDELWAALRPLLPPEARPILTVVVDTEEEFDWSSDFSRHAIGVGHLRQIERLQQVFDEFGIRPDYVVDYPVAAQDEGALPLKAIADSGRAEIGAHLHPWVTPPFEESVNARNSYPGNLPRELEKRKLEQLASTIGTALGVRPRVYKAGRYGFGRNTAAILEELGFEVDLSFFPPFDLREDGGPDYARCGAEPRWLGRERRLLALPMTGAYVGYVRTAAHPIYQIASHPALRPARLPGLLARLRVIDRLRLSPEGYTPEEHRRLTRFLLRRGLRTFTFGLHSPSILPGCTPYVRTGRDLTALLESCRRYFDYFLNELDGVSMTALELKRHLACAPVRAPA
jgi:hypothetical protein